MKLVTPHKMFPKKVKLNYMDPLTNNSLRFFQENVTN